MSSQERSSARGAPSASRPTEDHLMATGTALRCRECGREYPVAPIYTCEWCFGPLEATYDYEAIATTISREQVEAGPPSIWRYGPLLPVDASLGSALPARWTQLPPATR